MKKLDVRQFDKHQQLRLIHLSNVKAHGGVVEPMTSLPPGSCLPFPHAACLLWGKGSEAN